MPFVKEILNRLLNRIYIAIIYFFYNFKTINTVLLVELRSQISDHVLSKEEYSKKEFQQQLRFRNGGFEKCIFISGCPSFAKAGSRRGITNEKDTCSTYGGRRPIAGEI
jgi:hypothetical protein